MSQQTHAQQQAALGCAAVLDPKKHPRRAAISKARAAFEVPKALTPARKAALAERKKANKVRLKAKRAELAERAKPYQFLTITTAAKCLGVSRQYLKAAADEAGLRFFVQRFRR